MTSYIHGTDPVEQARLSRLNDLTNAASLGALQIRRGERALELGAGLGQFALLLARSSGERAVAVEYSSAQLVEAQRLADAAGETALVDFRQGDAAAPPLRSDEWGHFDVAHARFLLEHVTDPLLVVRQMVRAVKPGGRVVLEDDDHDVLRLWPEPPYFRGVWQAYQRSYDRIHCDPIVGRRLVQLLHQAGAAPRRSTWLPFGACAGSDAFELLVDNLVRILDGARDAILATAGAGREELDACLHELRLWGERPDAALWYGIAWAEGTKPL